MIADRSAQAFGNIMGRFRLDIRQNRNKLLPAQPGNKVKRAQIVAQAAGKAFQNLVTDAVAVGVIDRFKVINIQIKNGH